MWRVSPWFWLQVLSLIVQRVLVLPQTTTHSAATCKNCTAAVMFCSSEYGACIEGKQNAMPSPRTPILFQARVPYAESRVDIAQMNTTNAGGSKYCTVMVDEATGFLWVFSHSTNYQSVKFVEAKIGKVRANDVRVKVIR
jgi:hypothetical protein